MLSHRGYHQGCGLRKAEQAAREMAARRGPAWEAWLLSNGKGAAEILAGRGSPHPAGRQS